MRTLAKLRPGRISGDDAERRLLASAAALVRATDRVGLVGLRTRLRCRPTSCSSARSTGRRWVWWNAIADLPADFLAVRRAHSPGAAGDSARAARAPHHRLPAWSTHAVGGADLSPRWSARSAALPIAAGGRVPLDRSSPHRPIPSRCGGYRRTGPFLPVRPRAGHWAMSRSSRGRDPADVMTARAVAGLGCLHRGQHGSALERTQVGIRFPRSVRARRAA